MIKLYLLIQPFALGGQALLAGLLICLAALVGSVSALLSSNNQRRFTQLALSLSVGVLLGDTFLHLLPDALERLGNVQTVMNGTLGGILLFFLLEKGVRRKHHSEYGHSRNLAVKPFAFMNLIGDGFHNFIDGTLIAGSFLASPEAGWATTMAIFMHELPQEISDVGMLRAGGYSLHRAVWMNFLCALCCLPGVALMLIGGHWFADYTAYTLPVTAGGFIYIAACDLIPELHRQTNRSAPVWQSLFIALGVGCMASMLLFE